MEKNLPYQNLPDTPFNGFKAPFHRHNGIDAPTIPLTIYTGYVPSTGNPSPQAYPMPAGWTYLRTNTGEYTVYHNLGTKYYTVMAVSSVIDRTGAGQGTVKDTLTIKAMNPNNFVVNIFTTSLAGQGQENSDFIFVVFVTKSGIITT